MWRDVNYRQHHATFGGWDRPGPGGGLMRDRPNDRLAILAYDHLKTFEFGIAVELFALDRPEVGCFYDVTVAAVTPGPLQATGGFVVTAEHGLDDARGAGTLVVPGWPMDNGPLADPVRQLLRDTVAAGGRVVGICSGTWAVAAAGLLDGRRATTHWLFAEGLARRFPRVQVDPDVLFVDEGDVLTSAGSAAGIDAGLHLIRHDWGGHVAATIARRMVMPPHRDGGQAQYVSPPPRQAEDWLAGLQDWVVGNLDRPLALTDLAGRVGVSPRTLTRRFEQSLGTSPGRWLVQQRLARAQELLLVDDASVEQVARSVGFGAAVTLRHHFRRQLGTTPTAYRSRFGT
ncbi:Transcriptional regulator, AraC family [Euzebya pacifica]|uniref:Transcriptional regulator, AraC family n=2 Tax=Euzebya pacifica TaxID=1608957 RepID=A0A346XVU9_9ACTN|nr:Transcriptional regulator, AraC family [Euzebya pacifica]